MEPASDKIYDTLKRYWGFTEFRPVQERIIRSVMEGRDTLALMPTGGGKSLTYQVPTLAREGVCIVVTPLIALMKDQVDRLQARRIPAVAIHSGLSPRAIDIALDNCVYGDVKFLCRCANDRPPGVPACVVRMNICFWPLTSSPLHLAVGLRLPPLVPAHRRTARKAPPESPCWRSPPRPTKPVA